MRAAHSAKKEEWRKRASRAESRSNKQASKRGRREKEGAAS